MSLRRILPVLLTVFSSALLAQIAPPTTSLQDRADAGCRLLASPESATAGAFWPAGVVPYTFAANVTAAMQAAILPAMVELQNAAHVTFVPRVAEADYVVITDAPLNSSPVGRQGGAQQLLIYNWNSRFQMVHELMHVLGFWHEHQRPDRDTYITVQWANVIAASSFDFVLAPTLTTFSTSYDFDSLMHFAGTEASSNNQPTILVLAPNQGQQSAIGQRTHLSASDLTGLHLAYGSPLPPTITQVSPPSTTCYQPSPIVLTGLLFDEVVTVRLDGNVLAFVRPAPNQVRIVLPLSMTIGTHQLVVESRTGPSVAAPLQITGNDPPVLEGNAVWIRGTYANPVRVHSDATRFNVLLGSLDQLPTVVPGVLQLGIGNQFQSLFVFGGPAVAGPNGVWTSTFVVPSTVPANTYFRLQSLVYDPNNVVLPFVVSNVFSPRTF